MWKCQLCHLHLFRAHLLTLTLLHNILSECSVFSVCAKYVISKMVAHKMPEQSIFFGVVVVLLSDIGYFIWSAGSHFPYILHDNWKIFRDFVPFTKAYGCVVYIWCAPAWKFYPPKIRASIFYRISHCLSLMEKERKKSAEIVTCMMFSLLIEGKTVCLIANVLVAFTM